MKTKSKLLLLVLCLMPLCAAAQDSDEADGNSGKNTAWEPSERYDIVEFPWSKMLKYEEADLPEAKSITTGTRLRCVQMLPCRPTPALTTNGLLS